MRLVSHTVIALALTVLTQIGGIVWLFALLFRRRFLVFGISYVVACVAVLWIAPVFGRVPLPCLGDSRMKLQTPVYCMLNRQYVVPELRSVLTDYAAHMEDRFPGTQTRILDANFPFLTGFPLLPHLSHDDGRKVDLAFYYKDEAGYRPGVARSPIGYFAFEDGPTECPSNHLTLRWNMGWLQGHRADLVAEPERMTAAMAWLGTDARVGKVFIEPHLKDRFGPQEAKIRFQGCRAARHDDHIHIQL